MPSTRSNSRIGEQHTAYRRGLVLGLTMAEVGILVIFILLLLLALGALQLQRVVERAPTPERLEQLEASEAALRSIREAVGAGPAETPEEIQELVRAVSESAQSPQAQHSLRAVRTARDEIERTEEEIRRVAQRLERGSSGGIAETVAQQSRDLAIKEGQLQYAEQRLRAALGQGAGARPCWVEADGSIVFLYDVILTSGGIRMKLREDVRHSARLDDLPLAAVDPATVLGPEEFRDQTRALYDYGRSDEHQCRFHVYVYDGTQTAEKERYKDLLRTVEGHFYKQTTVPNGVPF
jgi:hypothetical protein